MKISPSLSLVSVSTAYAVGAGSALCLMRGGVGGMTVATGVCIWAGAGALAACLAGGGMCWRISRRRNRALPWMKGFFCASILALGFLSASVAHRRHVASMAQLDALCAQKQRIAFTATIVGEPVGRRIHDTLAVKTVEARITGYAIGTNDTPVRPVVLPVAWYGFPSILAESSTRASPRAGETWTIIGRLKPSAFGTVPYSITTSTTLPSVRHPDAPMPVVAGLLVKLRREASRSLTLGVEDVPDAPGILRAMTLGERGALDPDTKNSFVRSGTVHLFAISGLHVGIVAGFIYAVCAWCGLSRRQCFWVLLVLVPFYTLLTGARPSAIRACMMVLFAAMGLKAWRQSNLGAAIALTALLLLLLNPLYLLDIGFIFSFAGVLAIFWMAAPVDRYIKSKLYPPRTAPKPPPEACTDADDVLRRAMEAATKKDRVPRPAWMQKFLGKLAGWIRGGIAYTLSVLTVSTAISLVLTPLTAMTFGTITPVAILANLFAIPMGTGVVLCGATSLATGVFSDTLPVVSNMAACAILTALVKILHVFASPSWAMFTVTPWTMFHAALWYAGLGGAVMGGRKLWNDKVRMKNEE